MGNPNLGQPVKNKHKVPKKQWDKWSNLARRVFNDMMYSMRPSMQFAFHHPSTLPLAKEQWQTTRWNAAWSAAEAVKGFRFESATKLAPLKTKWVKPAKRKTKRKVRRGK